MGLTNTFQKAAVTAFKVAGDIPVAVLYRLITDTGLVAKTEVDYPTEMIPEKATYNSTKNYSFRDRVLPNDVIGLIPGLSIDVNPLPNNQIVEEDAGPGGVDLVYEIIDKDIDPANALHILLLRNA